MNEGQAKGAPPLLGRYRLLKEKRKSATYRSFLAYDLKLKRGVIVKLIPVHGFQRKHLPILWEHLEKVFRQEENASRIVELDCQKDNLFVVEEYLEGRYFNSQIVANRYEYERFEAIVYRLVDLINRLHTRRIPHGFLDFANIKVTPSDAIVLDDYPLLGWLENNRLLPSSAIPPGKFSQSIRDLRQLGLILFNVYRTQLVPEFGSFPEKYTKEDIYDFFHRNSFTQFSDVERILGRLLLSGENKGFASTEEAFREVRDVISNIPHPVQIREIAPSQLKVEKPGQAVIDSQAREGSDEFSYKRGRSTETLSPTEARAEAGTSDDEVSEGRRPEIYTRRELRRENLIFKGIAWIALAASIVIMALALTVMVRGLMASSKQEVAVPDLVGMSFKDAEKKVAKLGLKIKISNEQYSQEIPKGMIIQNQPPTGTRTKAGRTVYAVISKGLAVVTVPNLINQKEAEAEASLKAFQLIVGKKEYVYSEEVPLGTVIDQSPSASDKVAVNEKISLIISAGVLKSKIPMPELKGMPLSEALSLLEQKKLRVKKIDRTYSPNMERDAVTFQNPPAGEDIESGTYVDVTVVLPAKSAPPEEFNIAMTVKLPDFQGRKRVRITVRNAKSTREIYNQMHSGREQVSILAEGVGRSTVQVYLEDELIREETF